MPPGERPEHPDKLTHNERLRLEALAQAIAYRGGFGTTNAEAICADADVFVLWIEGRTDVWRTKDLYSALTAAKEMPNASADEIIDLMKEVRAEEATTPSA